MQIELVLKMLESQVHTEVTSLRELNKSENCMGGFGRPSCTLQWIERQNPPLPNIELIELPFLSYSFPKKRP